MRSDAFDTQTMERPATAEILRQHVAQLADQIGERNVWRPAALQAAAR